MLGDRTRSRGTPLPVAIVRHLAANFIRNHFHIASRNAPRLFHNRSSAGPTPPSPGFYIAGAGEGGNPFLLFGCSPDFPLPLQPHPPKSADIHKPVASDRLLKSNSHNLLG